MKICSKCGCSCQDTSRFCISCGNAMTGVGDVIKPANSPCESASMPSGTPPMPVNQKVVQNQTSTVTQPVQQSVYCPNCRNPIQNNWQVCAFCGAGLRMPPQPQGYYSNGYPMTQGYAYSFNQPKSVNPIAILALILGLILLFTPCIETWRAEGIMGLSNNVSFVETIFIDEDDRDEYESFRDKHWDARNEHKFVTFLGFAAIFSFTFVIISYILSIRALSEKKFRKFWSLLGISGRFCFLGNILSLLCFLIYKNTYKDLLDRSSITLSPTPWIYIVFILVSVNIIMCGMMKKKEKDAEKLPA